MIAKITYIADVIEPERTEPENKASVLKPIRTIVKTDLQKALLAAVEYRLQKSLHLHSAIFSRTVELWNELVSSDKKL